MGRVKAFESYASVEAVERAERQKSETELRHALNNHADRLVDLQTHHESMHASVAHLKDQMDCVLDSLTQINQRLDALEKARG